MQKRELELTKKREEKFGVFLRHYEGGRRVAGFFIFLSLVILFFISLIFFSSFNIPPLAGATGQGGN